MSTDRASLPSPDRAPRSSEEDWRRRVLVVVGAVFLYWLGNGIPIPGVDASAFALDFSRYASTYLQFVNIILGDGVRRVGILSLGLLPYVSGLIVMLLAA